MRLFPRKEADRDAEPSAGKGTKWWAVAIVPNIVLIAAALIFIPTGVAVQQSNTNPRFCGFCHVMQSNVQSYLTSNHLDNVHEKAGVQCKDCHDYPLPKEILSGAAYVAGSYEVNKQGELVQRTFGDEMCNRCHVSLQHVADQTDFLRRNPHFSHWGEVHCSDCHISHGPQINFCKECHDNGGQRMVEDPIVPRAENPWLDPNKQRPNATKPVVDAKPGQ